MGLLAKRTVLGNVTLGPTVHGARRNRASAWHGWPASLIATTWLLTSCTTNADRPAAVAPQPSTSTVTVASGDDFGRTDLDPPVTVDAATKIWRSPVEELLGFEADPARLSEAYRVASVQRQETIDRCMATEGYDGYVHDPPEVLPTPEMLVAATPTQDLARYGYGPIAVVQSQFDVLLDGSSEEGERPAIVVYLEERPHLDENKISRTLNACIDEAWTAFPPPQRSFPQELTAEIAELRSAVYQSAPVSEAWSAWSRCMAENGYDVADRDAARGWAEAISVDLFDQLNQWAAENHSPSPTEADAFADRLDDARTQERQLVEADLACADEHQVESTLHAELSLAEQEWVDEHRDRVELLLAESSP